MLIRKNIPRSPDSGESQPDGAREAKWEPGYLKLLREGELERRVDALESMLGPTCRLCPRQCRVDRLADHHGACFGGRRAAVASWCDHHGEEPPISGRRGSGTIFLGGCNLRCIYCQNYQISQPGERLREREMEAAELAGVMLALQERGCHNINFVSPTQFSAQCARGVLMAAQWGLRVPIVYNSNGYDAPEVIRLLDGIVDIYLPDLKYADNETARRYSGVEHYVENSRAAVAEMWRQVGPIQLDRHEVARRGMIVRHLVLPNDLADSEQTLEWLAETCGTGVTLSLMAQYYPAHKAEGEPLLGRGIRPREYARVVDRAQRLGFEHMLIQDEMLSPEYYRPDFSQAHPFEWS